MHPVIWYVRSFLKATNLCLYFMFTLINYIYSPFTDMPQVQCSRGTALLSVCTSCGCASPLCAALAAAKLLQS